MRPFFCINVYVCVYLCVSMLLAFYLCDDQGVLDLENEFFGLINTSLNGCLRVKTWCGLSLDLGVC